MFEYLPNVIVGKKLIQFMPTATKENLEIHAELGEVIDKVAKLYPMWRFELVSEYDRKIQAVEVFFDATNEELGTIVRRYARGDWKVEVNNPRIRASRSNASGYATRDANKAVSVIKKNFFPTTTNERVEIAGEQITNQINQALRRYRNDANAEARLVHEHAKSWAISTDGFIMFMNFLQQNNTYMFQQCKQHLDKQGELMEKYNMMNAIAEAKHYVIVVIDNGRYLCKYVNKGARTYNDDDLPHDIRSKIGFLKLAGDNDFVSTVGYRMNATSFLIALEGDDEECV
jgi:hypothetical protein